MELSAARGEVTELLARVATLNLEAADARRRFSTLSTELNAAQQHISGITTQLDSSRTVSYTHLTLPTNREV